MLLKVKFWHFLTARHYSNSQNSIILFDYSWFLPKNLSNFLSLPWKLNNRYCHNATLFKARFALCLMWPYTTIILKYFRWGDRLILIDGSWSLNDLTVGGIHKLRCWVVDQIFPILPSPTYPWLTFVKEFLYCCKEKSAYCWHLQDHLPTYFILST